MQNFLIIFQQNLRQIQLFARKMENLLHEENFFYHWEQGAHVQYLKNF